MEKRERPCIFYSWQSDTAGACNRSLIETALTNVLDKLRADPSTPWDPILEQDARGAAGSPDIHREVFDKIDRAAVVVCDVTLIGRVAGVHEERPCINPNVGIELGYALGKRSERRVVLVKNTHFGTPEELPFDIRQKPPVMYYSAPSVQDGERAAARRDLEAKLEASLRATLAAHYETVEVSAVLKFDVPRDVRGYPRRDDRSTSSWHHYTLTAELANTGKRRIDDWQIEVLIPNDFYDGTPMALDTGSQDAQGRRRFLAGNEKVARELRRVMPGESRKVAFGIVVDDERHHASNGELPQIVTARAYIDGDQVGEVNRTIKQVSNF